MNTSKTTTTTNAPRFTTFAALLSNATPAAPARYWEKVFNNMLSSADVDTSALEWHLSSVGYKKWGAPCITFANAEKSALVVALPEKAEKADKGSALKSLFASINTLDDATASLLSATGKRCANGEAVAVVSSAVSAVVSGAIAIQEAADAKAARAAERAAAARQRVIDYFVGKGLATADAESKAERVAIIDGKKADNGLYTFKAAALLASFEYTFADKLSAARDAAKADAIQAAAAAKAERDATRNAEKAEKAAGLIVPASHAAKAVNA